MFPSLHEQPPRLRPNLNAVHGIHLSSSPTISAAHGWRGLTWTQELSRENPQGVQTVTVRRVHHRWCTEVRMNVEEKTTGLLHSFQPENKKAVAVFKVSAQNSPLSSEICFYGNLPNPGQTHSGINTVPTVPNL